MKVFQRDSELDAQSYCCVLVVSFLPLGSVGGVRS